MMQRMCTAAKYEAVFLAYLVAIPRHRFSSMKVFSTRWRRRYRYLSYLRSSLLFDLGGITGSIPASLAIPTIASLS